MIKKTLLFWSLSSFILGCKTTNNVNNNTKLGEIIYQDNYSGTSMKSYRLIKNFEDYKSTLLVLRVKHIPYVDFDKQNVLILNTGKIRTKGYSIQPDKMYEDKGNVILILKETLPKLDKMLYEISQPITILKINSKKELVLL